MSDIEVVETWKLEEDALAGGIYAQLACSQSKMDRLDAYWRLAKCVTLKRHVKTIRESEPRAMMYYYNGGNYTEPAEGVLCEDMKKIAGRFITRHAIGEVISHIKGLSYVAEEDFDKDPDLLVVGNGVLHVSTRTITPHDPAILNRVKLPVSFDVAAACPRWTQFLEEVIVPRGEPISEEHRRIVATLQEYAGYCLFRDNRFEKSLMLTGAGRNGKSVFINTLTSLLGKENVSSVPLQKFDRGEYSLSQMVGKLANFYADLSDKALDASGNFKMITSGDAVYVNRKYLNPISTTIFAKQIYSANKVPESKDLTPAFFRRWIIVNFPNVFEGTQEDKALKAKLELELPGILNWALAGIERLNQQQHFSYELNAEESELRYLLASSPVAAFVEMRLNKDSEATVTKDVMYAEFIRFAKENNMPTMADNAFARKLKECAVGIGEARPHGDKRDRVWRGYSVQDVQDVHVLRDIVVAGKNKEIHIENNLDNVDNLAQTILTFLQTGQSLKTADLVAGTGLPEADVIQALRILEHDGTITLDGVTRTWRLKKL